MCAEHIGTAPFAARQSGNTLWLFGTDTQVSRGGVSLSI